MSRSGGIYLFETKTKGDIKEQQIKRQLTFDLQTMLYIVALSELKKLPTLDKGFARWLDRPVRGVRYNVIRRPLSGGKGTIVQKKGTKNHPPETKEQYYSRLAEYISEEPETYFMRWRTELTQDEIECFKRECLFPLLENIADDYEWWDWCYQHGEEMLFNCQLRHKQFPHHFPRHFRMPFGIYNALLEGGSSDLDEYLATGSELGLQRVDTLFSELN